MVQNSMTYFMDGPLLLAALKSTLSSRVSKGMEHTIATIFLPRTAARHIPKIPGLGFVFQQDGALAHRARYIVAFLDRKVRDLISPTLWVPNSPDLNPDDYSIWSVGLMQEKVYRSRKANVNELEMCLIDEWGRFDQSIVDAALTSSGAVVSALVTMERGTL